MMLASIRESNTDLIDQIYYHSLPKRSVNFCPKAETKYMLNIHKQSRTQLAYLWLQALVLVERKIYRDREFEQRKRFPYFKWPDRRYRYVLCLATFKTDPNLPLAAALSTRKSTTKHPTNECSSQSNLRLAY